MSDSSPNAYAAPRAEALVVPAAASRTWRRFVRDWPAVGAAALAGAALMGLILFLGMRPPSSEGVSEVVRAAQAKADGLRRHAPPEELARLDGRVRAALARQGKRLLDSFGRGVLQEFGTQLIVNFYGLFVLALILGRERRRPPGMLGPGRIGRLITLCGMLAVLEVAGGYACVLPGLIIGVFDMFAPYLVILEGAGLMHAVGRSFALTWRGGLTVVSIGAASSVVALLAFFVLSRALPQEPLGRAILLAALDVVELPLLTLLWLAFWEDAVEREARPNVPVPAT